MKKHLTGVAISVMAILLLAPQCRADKTSPAVSKPDDLSVSTSSLFKMNRTILSIDNF